MNHHIGGANQVLVGLAVVHTHLLTAYPINKPNEINENDKRVHRGVLLVD